jgi:signal transduction histidine kinase
VKMEITQPESLKLFDMYHSQIVRVNEIVMGLINLTRISNQEERMSIIDFEKLVNDCVDSCKYLPQFESVRVEKEIASIGFKSEWSIVNTILQNLIENAIKYSRSQAASLVRIAIFLEANSVVIQVEDNGLGIDKVNHGNIFNMFFRGTHRSTGSGLGLYILKRAVERLNGNIEVESTLGEGSTFTVRLPHNA